MLIKIWICW